MSVVYLGNILGATGPVGPIGSSGCPSCLSFTTSEWSQLGDLSIFVRPNNAEFRIACWGVGNVITISGMSDVNVPVSEQVTIAFVSSPGGIAEITTSPTLYTYNQGVSLTICLGNNIGATGPSGGPVGPPGPIGATGPIGPRAECTGTSTDSLNLSHFSTDVGENLAITTEVDRCWAVGQLLIVSAVGYTTEYLIGKVLSYVGTTLTFKVVKRVGTLTINNWSISITGDVGPSGPIGLVGSTGPTGPRGLPGAALLRGTDNPDVNLNGDLSIDCDTTDVYNLLLKQNCKITLQNINPGQVVYIRVRRDSGTAVLTWENVINTGTILWEGGSTVSLTSSLGDSTIYKFIMIRYDGGSTPPGTIVATKHGDFGFF